MSNSLSNSSTEKRAMQSPLVQIDFSQLNTSSEVLSIEERAFLSYLNLRGSLQNKKFSSSVSKLLGLDLPSDANTFVSNETISILWYGPDEWLIIAEQGKASELLVSLRESLSGVHSSICDISGGTTALDISGSAASALLIKGCPLDLYASKFAPEQCAQTLIAKTGVTIMCCEAGYNEGSEVFSYRIIVRRSFSDYLGLWLLDAAHEFEF
jgi:sarcosine oxidase subunit gamma